MFSINFALLILILLPPEVTANHLQVKHTDISIFRDHKIFVRKQLCSNISLIKKEGVEAQVVWCTRVQNLPLNVFFRV